MKIVRHQNQEGQVQYASLLPDGSAFRIEGDLFSDYHATSESVIIGKVLMPVTPVQKLFF